MFRSAAIAVANFNSPTRIGPPSIGGRATKALVMNRHQPSSAGRHTDLPTIILPQHTILYRFRRRENSRVASNQVKHPLAPFRNFRFDLLRESFKVSRKAGF
jgi:hypothetical protein